MHKTVVRRQLQIISKVPRPSGELTHPTVRTVELELVVLAGIAIASPGGSKRIVTLSVTAVWVLMKVRLTVELYRWTLRSSRHERSGSLAIDCEAVYALALKWQNPGLSYGKWLAHSSGDVHDDAPPPENWEPISPTEYPLHILLNAPQLYRDMSG